MGWMLLQGGHVQQAVKEITPVVVRLLEAPPVPVSRSDAEPFAAMLNKPLLPAQTVPLVPPPLVEITTAAPTITVAVAQVTPREVVAAAAPVSPVPNVVPNAVPTAVSTAPSLPALKQVAPGAVRYRVEPRMTVPLMSRRLHESGVVVLRIAVDARGLLKSAAVHKSSGFERLDQQALMEIRSARFVPQTENGLPIEWETLAPMSYELD